MGRRGLPDRWINYSPVGEKIAGTSFIAFKVPLKEAFVRNLPENERFTTQMLMDSVPNIGLVIDLTNTDRYYNPQDFLGQGVRYEKIFCRGHEIPNQSVVDKFFSIVDKFWEHLKSSVDQDAEKLIGVHCTHGLNRTGYLVCRYMIRRLGFSPEEAISEFEKARGYPMEREEYLKSLRDNIDCSLSVVSDEGLKNHNNVDSIRNSHGSTSSCTTESDHSQNSQSRWTTGSGPCRASDMNPNDFRNFVHVGSTSSFRRFPSYRNDGFTNYCQSARAGNFSWPSDINSVGFNNFGNFPRNVRAAGHPYQWELRASFNPEERGTHNSRDISRRFYKQDCEENRVFRQQRFDYKARRPSSFSQDSRQTSPPVAHHHRHTRDYRGYDHSV